jgi:hypothetical protein
MHPGTPATSTATPSGNPTDLADAAAIAAVQRMYAEFNVALHSLRSDAYRQTFTKGCGYCVSNADLVDGLRDKRERIVGGQFSLTGLRVAYVQPTFVLVEGYLAQDAARITKQGSTVKDYKAAPHFRAIWRVERLDGTAVITKEDVPQ